MDNKFKKVYKHRFFVPGLLVVLALGFLWSRGLFNPARPTETIKEVGEKAVSLVTGGGGFDFDKNTPGYETYKQLKQGCPFKDCIPSIDEPIFESRSEAERWLNDGDVVFALDYKGVQRAYPQRILNWHEIVNDVVAGDPLAITFCPLCGSSLTFERSVDGRVLEFGVSGKLHQSDLIMYDRQTESLWQQITGEAIVGELLGEKLKAVPMDTVRWSEWKTLHPTTQVLSLNTGYSRAYDQYPYGSYEQDRNVNPGFFEGNVDETLHPKAIVFGVEINGTFKAYTEEALRADDDGVISDTLGGKQLRVTYNNGDLKVLNLTSGEELAPVRLFWFAWKDFHPETTIYQ